MEWTPRKPNGTMTTVEGLGTVELYRDKGGLALDINGKRAWSCICESEGMAQLSFQHDVKLWQYLNSFKA